MRTALDAMGGDYAPTEIVKGAVQALDELPPCDEIILVGPAETVEKELRSLGGPFPRITVEHAEQVIGMDESPVEALRKKPNSSIRRMVELMVEGKADAVLSAGNTGAVAAAAQMGARMLPGVRRPGILVVMPTAYGPVTVVDVGANLTPKPVHLAQYGVMASAYSNLVLGVAKPRVGLLSIGSEDAKGTELVQESRELLRKAPINFTGNAEGRDVFNGNFDVIVCDAFVGNVLLKVVEAMADGVFRMLQQEIASAADPELAERIKPILREVHRRHDYTTYGGAPLMGIGGICLIAHGSSNARAITSALKMASKHAAHKVNEAIVAALAPAGEPSK